MTLLDAFLIHAGTNETIYSGLPGGSYSFANFKETFAGRNAMIYFWKPFGNTMALAALSCVFAIAFGGGTAYLITRTNMPMKKWISAIFIIPYVMLFDRKSQKFITLGSVI